MAKRVSRRPDWIAAGRSITDIYSVSGCASRYFAEYIGFWRHNGYGLFDTPESIIDLARQHSIDLRGMALFFYEAYELEFDGATGRWTPVRPEPSFATDVRVPA